MFLKNSLVSQKNTCWSLVLSACKFFKKKLKHKCFPVKFEKLLRTAILKNICKPLLLEVFYKIAVLKNFAIFIGRKQLGITCSVKKVFLVVDRAVKVTCFFIDQHLQQKKCCWLNEKSSRPEVFSKKRVRRNFAKFTGKHLCQSLFFTKVTCLRPATFLRKTLAQVFSCEFCEISKNTFFHRAPLVAALK